MVILAAARLWYGEMKKSVLDIINCSQDKLNILFCEQKPEKYATLLSSSSTYFHNEGK